jgi:hypothetical protein
VPLTPCAGGAGRRGRVQRSYTRRCRNTATGTEAGRGVGESIRASARRSGRSAAGRG